jgi:hypothetical protein
MAMLNNQRVYTYFQGLNTRNTMPIEDLGHIDQSKHVFPPQVFSVGEIPQFAEELFFNLSD